MTDVRLLDLLTEALEDKYRKQERKGIHLSELVLCPRQAVCRRLDPKPLSLNTIAFFVSGQAMHEAIQYLAIWLGRKRVWIEKRVKCQGVFCTVDLVIDDDLVVEVKTTTSKKLDLRPHYKDQCEGYMAATNIQRGKILVFSLTNYDQRFQVHDIQMTDEQLETKRKWIEREGKQQKLAIRKKNWKLARAIKDNTNLNWLCRECQYKQPCFEYEETKVQ